MLIYEMIFLGSTQQHQVIQPLHSVEKTPMTVQLTWHAVVTTTGAIGLGNSNNVQSKIATII